MDFETMNWEDEARRVARAFLLAGNYEFESNREFRVFKVATDLGARRDITVGSIKYQVFYTSKIHYFRVANDINEWSSVSLYVNGGGVVSQIVENQGLFDVIVRALFHLNLLTPEIEKALKVSISAHQKLEWTLDKEERRIMT